MVFEIFSLVLSFERPVEFPCAGRSRHLRVGLYMVRVDNSLGLSTRGARIWFPLQPLQDLVNLVFEQFLPFRSNQAVAVFLRVASVLKLRLGWRVVNVSVRNTRHKCVGMGRSLLDAETDLNG